MHPAAPTARVRVTVVTPTPAAVGRCRPAARPALPACAPAVAVAPGQGLPSPIPTGRGPPEAHSANGIGQGEAFQLRPFFFFPGRDVT